MGPTQWGRVSTELSEQRPTKEAKESIILDGANDTVQIPGRDQEYKGP